MRSPKQQTSERRVEAARPASAGSVKAGARQSAAADQKVGVVTSMVDALEDILKWERASERALRVAGESSTTDVDGSAAARTN